MKKRRITSFVLAVGMVIATLTGCSVKSDTPIIGKVAGLKENQIFKIDERICTKPEYMLVLMNTQNQYKSGFGKTVDWDASVDNGITLKSYVMEKVKEDITVKYTLSAMAQSKGVTLTEKEKSKIADAAKEYFNSLSEEEKSYTGAEASDVETVYTNYLLADKLYSKLTEGVGQTISDEEARVIKIQYIRMSLDNTKESKITSTLKNVIDLVNGGYQEFSREAKQYTEDDVVERTLKKNEITEKYEEEAFNLNSEEMSNIIQDGNDYYLVYCVDSYLKKETENNKKKIINAAKEEYFNKQYNLFLDSAETDFNTSEVDKMELSTDTNIKNTSLMENYNSMFTDEK